ncbi:hypothetical protein D1BOALGB6SA_10026 [Olavius sp. associated proteobacterium Delta 1]|nr:hypothetical protein D1BOALGB6SA_10026 [Olavius sp. associated proteobacterium Delta 1]
MIRFKKSTLSKATVTQSPNPDEPEVSLILLMQTKKNIAVIQLLSQLPAAKLILRADDRFLFSYNRDLLPAEISQRLTP